MDNLPFRPPPENFAQAKTHQYIQLRKGLPITPIRELLEGTHWETWNDPLFDRYKKSC